MRSTKQKDFVYRGILVQVNGPYSIGTTRIVVVHFPTQEAYFTSTAGVRSAIDKFLSTYQPVDNGIPF
jgi:hypothetical protein